MKEYPRLLNGEMVRAVLEGMKTQTRCAGQWRKDRGGRWFGASGRLHLPPAWAHAKAGDVLWVRETWAPFDATTMVDEDRSRVFYRADDEMRHGDDGAWRPSIHMPRWACRLVLRLVEDVRGEHLQDITEDGARAEGIQRFGLLGGSYFATSQDHQPSFGGSARDSFRSLWVAIYGEDPRKQWDANPVVWVARFRPEVLRRG